MNEPGPVTSGDALPARPVFISYATADRKEALSVCKAIERRGVRCWISTRDVAPGENYQEAIVHSLRGSRAMVLVFSEAANNSDEIKKELSLASRYHVPVMALRIEDVEPSDAFAYELSTRQWIDAFEGWDKSIDALIDRLQQVAGTDPAATTLQASRAHSRRRRLGAGLLLSIAAAVVLIVAAGLIWFTRRPVSPAAAQAIQVRLAGFEKLSPGVPAGMPDTLRDELIAAFNDDGLVTVSTAPAPPPGTSPAYALGGSIRSQGSGIRIITRLTNERSGVTLWSNSFGYDAGQVARAPRRIAVDAGNVVRCGLFGAATYRKRLPDAVLADYLQFCHYTNLDFVFSKALYFARKTVAAAPDSIRLSFSQTPELKVTTVTVTGPGSASVALAPLASADSATVVAGVKGKMAAGTYTVAWRTMAKDGHVARGTFAFTLAPAKR